MLHDDPKPTLSPNGPDAVIACHDCGTLHKLGPLRAGEGARCVVCDRWMATAKHNSVERALALTVASAVLFVAAHILPFMTFALEGREITSEVWAGAIALAEAGMWPLGVLVLLLATIIPGFKIGLGLFVLGKLWAGRTDQTSVTGFRWMRAIAPWSMMEVLLLGIIVAFVKLSDLADLGLEPGLWCFAVLVIILTAADFILDPREVWDRLQPQATIDEGQGASYCCCHVCGQIGNLGGRCRRCDHQLHPRKPNAILATWALVIAASLLYIPANLLPIMTVTSFGRGEPDTILSGVVKLLEAGMFPVAVLVFVASVLVPVLKLLGLMVLLISVQWRSRFGRKDRTKLYRLIETVGRWSMVDIFMIAILTSLVNLGNIATIEPGAGALCFAAVVVLTMIASMRFDPRLIWDAPDGRFEPEGLQRV